MIKQINILVFILLCTLSISCNRVDSTGQDNINAQQFLSLSTSLYHNSFAIDSTGALWGTGRNEYCELGDAISVCDNDVTTYVKTTLTGAKQVANGNFHTVVLMNDGTVRVAGDRTRGQIGISTGPTEVNNFIQPEFESESPISISKVATGHYGTYLLDTDGLLWGTGYYFNGQLTYNNAPTFDAFKNQFIKVPTPDGVRFTDITYGYDQVLAIDTDGNIWATGGNRFGQLGIGADVNNDVYGFTKFNFTPPIKFIAVVAGGAGAGNGTDAFNGKRHTLALDEEGSIWVTGNNDFGQLGTGDFISTNTFKKISKPAGVNKFTKISAGGMTSVALTDTGDVYVTGNNIDYALGISEAGLVNEFTKVPKPEEIEEFIDISSGARHTQILDNKGKIWTAGANQYGQLGLGLEISLNSVAKTFTNSSNKTEMLPTTPMNNPIVVENSIPDDTIKIGFVGNSLVFTNDVPLRLKEIATANGKKVDVKYQAISGDILKNQFIYRDWAAHRIVAYYRPKYVFFQEQTSGRELAQIGWWKAFASSYNIEPILYQAWYNTNGCIGTDTNSDELGVKVAPVGYAFHKGVRGGAWKCVNKYNGLTQQEAMNQDIKYTKPNDYHPNMKGAYLSALTLYSTVFGITSGTIIKPDVLNTQGISNTEWDEMVTLAIGAINNNIATGGTKRALRSYISNAINNSPITLTSEYQNNTYSFTKYIAQNIPFNMPRDGELDIKMDTDDAGSFYWFLRESNGRLVGKSAPSMPWPNREVGSCLNNNSLEFNNVYSCLEDKSLSDVFFGYGDRVAGGIPYENKVIPAGDYVLTLIEASGINSNTTLNIKIR